MVIIMLYVEPDFYGDFQCLAGECRHSCCLGWEIDIDADTAQLYTELPGPVGDELRREICMEPEPHFRLDKEERCPFLNRQNLCRLILTYGEDALCDICREHPRFYNEFPARLEAGLGLCCEEAVHLLLSGEKPLELMYAVEGENEDEEPELIAQRREMLATLGNLELPMEGRAAHCCRLMDEELLHFDLDEWRDFCLGLERMDERWTEVLSGLNPTACPMPGDLKHTRFVQYLIYRHFAAADDREQAALVLQFCFLSLKLMWAMERSGGELWELVRLYSSEIEYSDENIERILQAIRPLLFPD